MVVGVAAQCYVPATNYSAGDDREFIVEYCPSPPVPICLPYPVTWWSYHQADGYFSTKSETWWLSHYHHAPVIENYFIIFAGELVEAYPFEFIVGWSTELHSFEQGDLGLINTPAWCDDENWYQDPLYLYLCSHGGPADWGDSVISLGETGGYGIFHAAVGGEGAISLPDAQPQRYWFLP